MKKVLLVAVVSLGLLAGSVSSVNATSDWGDAIAIPALIGLNIGNGARGSSVSCASAGNCAVTGLYTDGAGDQQGFVVNQTDGTWGNAIAIPALSVLNTGGDAEGTSVSCASAGNCAVTGYYITASAIQGFVVNQTDGTWGNAIPIPALIGLNTGNGAEGTSESCASAGNCAVTGLYRDGAGGQGFVVNQTGGTWGNAIAIPALSGLNTGDDARGSSVSCASAGNCAVTGYYGVGLGDEGFVVTQTDGTWGDAIPIPALIGLNTGANADSNSVSCASAGNCAVTGYYDDGTDQQGFVVNQTGGTWGNAIAIPALSGLNTSGNAGGSSVSCASAGNCAVTGFYKDSAGGQGFVVNQTSGTWGSAIAIPALSSINTAGDAEGSSVSCASAGNCAVTGYYKAGAGLQGFVVNQTNGTWGNAIAIPALSVLNTGANAQGTSVSCASAGNCAVTGYYTGGSGFQGFVVNQTNGTWGNAIAIPALSVLNTGANAEGTSVSCASAGNCAVTGFYNNGAGPAGGIGVVPARPAGDQGFVVNLTSVVPPTDPAVVLKFTG